MEHGERVQILGRLSESTADEIIANDLCADGDINFTMSKIHADICRKHMADIETIDDAKILLAHALSTHVLRVLLREQP